LYPGEKIVCVNPLPTLTAISPSPTKTVTIVKQENITSSGIAAGYIALIVIGILIIFAIVGYYIYKRLQNSGQNVPLDQEKYSISNQMAPSPPDVGESTIPNNNLGLAHPLTSNQMVPSTPDVGESTILNNNVGLAHHEKYSTSNQMVPSPPDVGESTIPNNNLGLARYFDPNRESSGKSANIIPAIQAEPFSSSSLHATPDLSVSSPVSHVSTISAIHAQTFPSSSLNETPDLSVGNPVNHASNNITQSPSYSQARSRQPLNNNVPIEPLKHLSGEYNEDDILTSNTQLIENFSDTSKHRSSHVVLIDGFNEQAEETLVPNTQLIGNSVNTTRNIIVPQHVVLVGGFNDESDTESMDESRLA
jgi:hypothetical protein